MDTRGERWVTIAAAAELLGKSERTIRRWEHDGKIEADRTGPVLRVNIAGLAPAQSPAMPNVAALQAEIDGLRALLAEVRSERDNLRSALANAQALSMSLTGDQRLLTERAGEPRRRFRWPWQRRDEG